MIKYKKEPNILPSAMEQINIGIPATMRERLKKIGITFNTSAKAIARHPTKIPFTKAKIATKILPMGKWYDTNIVVVPKTPPMVIISS